MRGPFGLWPLVLGLWTWVFGNSCQIALPFDGSCSLKDQRPKTKGQRPKTKSQRPNRKSETRLWKHSYKIFGTVRGC